MIICSGKIFSPITLKLSSDCRCGGGNPDTRASNLDDANGDLGPEIVFSRWILDTSLYHGNSPERLSLDTSGCFHEK